MSERSGRTGSAGRFGARYGRVARRRVAEIEAGMREAFDGFSRATSRLLARFGKKN